MKKRIFATLVGLSIFFPAVAQAESIDNLIQQVEGRFYSSVEIQAALEDGGCDAFPQPVQAVCLIISIQSGGERAREFASATNGMSGAAQRAQAMNRQYLAWKKEVAPNFNHNYQYQVIDQYIQSVGN